MLLDQDDEVLVVDFLLLVGQGLEVLEDDLDLFVVEPEAQLGDPLAEGVPAGANIPTQSE